MRATAFLPAAVLLASLARADGTIGYYRTPAISRDWIVFVAEEDLWRVPPAGGVAARLTTHPGGESRPVLSPDGATVAFTAEYEGAADVYTMPVTGGLPVRRTWEGRAAAVAWTPEGKLVCATRRTSTLPATQLAVIDVSTGERSVIPLAQAAEGAFDGAGTLYFTRLAPQGSQTKRYKGGTAQNLWKFDLGRSGPVAFPPPTGAAAPGGAPLEAVPLTADYPGTSARPMWWEGRLYFASDRDGTMNIWSMSPSGGDLKQHTRHAGIEVRSPAMSDGRIAYQHGADIRVLDVRTGDDRAVPITLASDMDLTREKWIRSPMEYATSVHLSPDGDRVAITARGHVFVAPRKQGRLVEVTRDDNVRQRDGRFMPGGDRVLTLSDESGEVELWTYPANGVEVGATARARLTTDGGVLRMEASPSPDGSRVAYHDKNLKLWILEVSTGKTTQIDEDPSDGFGFLTWSDDSRWLAYAGYAHNANRQVRIYSVEDGTITNATTDRYDSYAPAWSADGRWLYFLSDRNFVSTVPSPWGPLAPEPYFDNRTKILALALKPGLRSPFDPKDELAKKPDEKAEPKKEEPGKEEPPKDAPGPEAAPAPEGSKDGAKSEPGAKAAPKPVEIDLAGLAQRIYEIPVPPGNYGALFATEKRLLWTSAPSPFDGPYKLQALDIDEASIEKRDFEVKTIAPEVSGVEISLDRKALLFRKGQGVYVVDASSGPITDLSKSAVDLAGWTFAISPRQEWRQMFVESWRLERDYFYDRGMHKVDWKGMLDRYLPFVDRVSSRADLSDLMAQMVSELSALHIFVNGGDFRAGPDNITLGTLGAVLVRDPAAGGYRIERFLSSDPDEPERRGPLERPGSDIRPGDIIERINGVETLSVPDPGVLLRGQAGRQVRLELRRSGESAGARVVTPVTEGAGADMRYHEWEYTRRLEVERASNGEIGYVHLRSMGSGDIAQWFRNFYSIFDRKGLIIDVRNNRGGNIDSWILSRLLRRAWFFWQPRAGDTTWNMQYAFRGHVAVLIDENSSSDGEAFPEGVRRLGIGTLIGTRTWGGEIWLSSSNFLVDRGIATAAEIGVFGPEGEWLIEGHGVEPDITVDNPPHATFLGEDAQLHAAIEHLKKQIRDTPIPPPPVPAYPDKSE